MAQIETWYNQDLQQPVRVHYLDGSLFSHNSNGNRIGVHVFNNGEPVTLTGTVSGYVVTADGSTVPCTGTRSGNSASILIPAAAYQPGAVFITLFITDGTTVTTLASVSTNVLTARTNNQIDPGSVVTDWTQTINTAMQSVETAAENLGGIIAVPYANITYPVPLGKYTYYEGNLYRCISPIATSESFTAAHWTQVRLGDDVSDLKSALSDILIPGYSWTEQTLNFASTNGYWQTDGQYFAYSGMYKASFATIPGKKYKLNGYSFWAACNIVFKNGESFVSGIVISESTNAFENYEFTIPQGANICEIYKNGENKQFKLYSGKEVEIVFLTAEQIHYKEITEVDQILDDCTTPELRNKQLTFSAKSGYYEASGTYYNYNNVYGAELTVSEGEKYLLTGTNYYAMAAVCFFSSGNTFVSGLNFGDNENDYSEEITVPSNASRMLIQKYKNDTITNLYEYSGKYIYKKPLYTYESLLNEKKITVIGDSITEYNYRAKTNWAMYLANWTGARVQNLGISGTGFANSDPYINRLSRIQTNPDIIGVAMSWNDMSAGLPAGNADDTGTSSLAGYANDFFDALITRYPTVPIICYCQGPWNSYRPGVEDADTWITLLKVICHKKGIPFYDDLFFGSVLRPWNPDNKEMYYKSDNESIGNTGVVDNVHPNSIGHKVIARYLYPKFTQNIVSDGLDYTAE